MSQSEQVSSPLSLSKSKRLLLIFGILFLQVGFNASGYGAGVASPAKLSALGGMDFFALSSALGTLGMMLTLPITGKLCDIFGIKAVTIVGVLIQSIAKLAIVFSQSTLSFLLLGFISSLGGGLFVAAPFSLIADIVVPDERTKYFGLLTTFRAFGSLCGPLLSVILMDRGMIDYAFIAYFPFMILALPPLLFIYPARVKRVKSPVSNPFDIKSVVYLMVSVSCLILWLSLGGKSFAWLSIS